MHIIYLTINLVQSLNMHILICFNSYPSNSRALLYNIAGFNMQVQNYIQTKKYFDDSGFHVGKTRWKKGFSVNPKHS